MIFDKGLNDYWIKPEAVAEIDANNLLITIQEPLNQFWQREIITYQFPHPVSNVSCSGKNCPFQISGNQLALLVENLNPGECRKYHVCTSLQEKNNNDAEFNIALKEENSYVIADNGKIGLKLPKSQIFARNDLLNHISGPIISVKKQDEKWLGEGTLELSSSTPLSVQTSTIETGKLWSTVEVKYLFPENKIYSMQIKFSPDESYVEITEKSTLPVHLKPGFRPYREIGSLGTSFWNQPLEKLALPCIRQIPDSNFIFNLNSEFNPDRVQTHSTASWEIMDLPLHSETLKTYTVMRPVNPSMDGGWISFYSSKSESVINFTSTDICHWQIPDKQLHPIHRTPGASAEIICLDSKEKGTNVRFPIQNMARTWILNVAKKMDYPELFTVTETGKPAVTLDANPKHPAWALRNRFGDYRLDKVKNWIVNWSDTGHPHPALLCKSSDFESIRKKVRNNPELNRYYEKNRHIHSSDRFIIAAEKSGLASIEQATKAKQLVENMLEMGYIGPHYAIGLARPLRRYVIACDLEWNSFSDQEKDEARRVCVLAAYILSDGDYWQYAWTPGETTYLPNFNTDVFTCYGFIGMFLQDHPCSQVWTDALIKRLEIDLKYHIREDGCGEENLGAYNIATWTQLWLPAFWALKHTGIRDFSNDSRIHAAARFFLDILAPPDPRNDFKRSIPPIGHHPMAKKDVEIAPGLASFLKDTNPTLAANLMWLWDKSGKPVRSNTDHSGPEGDPHTQTLVYCDPAIKAEPYRQFSRELPCNGAVLHSHTNTKHGSFLILKAGRVHSHHDADEGSFHYFARGVPLALDGLPLVNIPYDESAVKHNVISFDKPGQPTGIIEKFVSLPQCDYVRANVKPRNFACDAMHIDNQHRSGFCREIIMVKSGQPGGVEYLVVKDVITGPDPCSWNLDVLSRQPVLLSPGKVWFPGHKEEGFRLGLEVIMLEPEKPEIQFEEGLLGDEYNTDDRRKIKESHVDWQVVEHWLMHVAAGPGTTFVTVLFPRREAEASPDIIYNKREEVVTVNHDDGKDIIFMRSNNNLPVTIDNILFRGRTGCAHYRKENVFFSLLAGTELVLCQETENIKFI